MALSIQGKLFATSVAAGMFTYGAISAPLNGSGPAGYAQIHSLSVGEGSHPVGALLPVVKSFLYGTAADGGGGLGTIFRVTKDGEFRVIAGFGGDSYHGCGGHPRGGLSGSKNMLVTTSDTPSFVCESHRGGGSRLRTKSKLSAKKDGYFATGTLVAGMGNAAYGGRFGQGTVFLGASVVHAFDGVDGAQPSGSLFQGVDGTLYGTTQAGGTDGLGTIFSIDATRSFESLHSFASTECSGPVGDLVQVAGDLYGTCAGGGAHGLGAVFKFTSDGQLTILHDFGAYPRDGELPLAGLTLSPTPGVLYGTTSAGGHSGMGTVYRITDAGDMEVVHSFCDCNGDGYHPAAPLSLADDGKMYGTTMLGGAFDDSGTVFVLHRPD